MKALKRFFSTIGSCGPTSSPLQSWCPTLSAVSASMRLATRCGVVISK